MLILPCSLVPMCGRHQEFQEAREALLNGDRVAAQQAAGRMTNPDGFVGSFEYAGELHLEFGGGIEGGGGGGGKGPSGQEEGREYMDGYIRHLHLNNATGESAYIPAASPEFFLSQSLDTFIACLCAYTWRFRSLLCVYPIVHMASRQHHCVAWRRAGPKCTQAMIPALVPVRVVSETQQRIASTSCRLFYAETKFCNGWRYRSPCNLSFLIQSDQELGPAEGDETIL